jgi:hypothetical protein
MPILEKKSVYQKPFKSSEIQGEYELPATENINQEKAGQRTLPLLSYYFCSPCHGQNQLPEGNRF